MSERARAWLCVRAGAVPPALEARMESAVDEILEYDTIPDMLADAARGCLRAALASPDERSAALHLLAADALITYACEAAAGAGGTALDDLAAQWTAEQLAHLLSRDGA